MNPIGFLTLGNSETIGTFSELFTLVDKKHKVFAKKATGLRPVFDFTAPRRIGESSEAPPTGTHIDAEALKGIDVYKEADRAVLNQYAPAGVLINEHMEILQFRGDMSHYLQLAPGKASFNLLQMAREGLLADLRAAIAEAKKTGSPIRIEGLRVRYEGRTLEMAIRVLPLALPAPLAVHYVILFEEHVEAGQREAKPARHRDTSPKREAERQLNSQLAQELEATKQYLHSIIERYETANEELKSANEEILSSNEELQSANEELETAKEELQSTNEELSTVNDELRQRNLELGQANSDLNNLFSSVNLPIIVLGSDLRIRRFTAAAERILHVIPTDVGRPIRHLNLNIPIPDLETLILEAIDTMSIREREVRDRQGAWYCLRIRPYKTIENKIDGATLLFIDIDSVKSIEHLNSLLEEVSSARHFAEGVVQSVGVPLLILDRELRVIKANPTFYLAFGTSQAETAQRFLYTVGNGQWNNPELRRLLGEIVPHNSQFDDFEMTSEFPGIGERTMLLNARRVTVSAAKEPRHNVC